MKLLYFNFAAIIVIAVMLVSMLMRRTRAYGNRTFLFATVVVLFVTIFDTGSVYLDNLGPGNAALKFLFHSSYLILHTYSSLFYLIYLISLTDTWQRFYRSRLRLMLLLLPALVYIGYHIAGWLGAPPVFYLDGAESRYTRGPTFYINYAVAVLYLLYGIYYILKFRKIYSTRWIVTLFVPYPIIGIAMVVEYVEPTMILEPFFNVIGLLFVYLIIQKPEEQIDSSTGLSNADAYETFCRRAYFNAKKMKVIVVDVMNYNSIRDTLDYDSGSVFRHKVADGLTDISTKLNLKARIFHGHQGRFFVAVDDINCDNVPEAAELYDRRMNSKLVVNGKEIHPKVFVCVLSAPDDFPDYGSFVRFCNNIQLKEGTVNYSENLFKEEYYNIFANIDRIVAEAIDNGRLEVYYQPIYSVKEKRYTCAEALLRLKDPEFGFISPAVFIPAAEQSGEINRIWDFVIASVCRFVSSQEFDRLGIEMIEVNLSAAQCMQEELSERIISVLDSFGVDHRRIAVEITETAFVSNPEILQKNLLMLSEAGIRICLDDFGTGYSDIRRVLELPFDVIKIDRELIKDMNQPGIKSVVIDTVKMMQHVGNLIVAEGVEDAETLELLAEYGCDFIQGFYFSKPVPESEFETLCLNGIT